MLFCLVISILALGKTYDSLAAAFFSSSLKNRVEFDYLQGLFQINGLRGIQENILRFLL